MKYFEWLYNPRLEYKGILQSDTDLAARIICCTWEGTKEQLISTDNFQNCSLVDNITIQSESVSSTTMHIFTSYAANRGEVPPGRFQIPWFQLLESHL